MKIKIKIILKWLTALTVLIIVYLSGVYSYKNELVRQKMASLKNMSYQNLNSLFSSNKTIKLELIIPDSSMNIIEKCREKAIKNNILRDKYKKNVPAYLVNQNDTFKVDLRLKGDYSDHWIGNKWSYRITMKGEDRLLGMKSFSLQSPETRQGLNEWYFHQLLKYENLIALRYYFIELTQNSIGKGLYALEESFSKELIENNNRIEGPIIKFDESILIDESILNVNNNFSQENLFLISKIEVYKSRKTINNKALYTQYKKGKKLLEDFRSGVKSVEKCFDIDKAAKLFAIADLTGGHHALRWKNIRFYYNSKINKLEMIGFDSYSGFLIDEFYYFKWQSRNLNNHAVFIWKNLFFKNKKFVNKYISYLSKYSSPKYLTTFNESIGKELNDNLSFLIKDNFFYHFYQSVYTKNALTISKNLETYDLSINPVFHNYFLTAKLSNELNTKQRSLNLKVKNNNLNSVRIIGLFNTNDQIISKDSIYLLNARERNSVGTETEITFHIAENLDSNQLKVKRKNSLMVLKKLKLGYVISGDKDTLYSKIEHYYKSEKIVDLKSNIENHDAFIIDHDQKKIEIKTGTWIFNQDINIPKFYDLTINANTTIELNNNSNLVINGKLFCDGKLGDEITIQSQDSSGSIIVYQSNSESIVNHTKFIGLAGSYDAAINVSGGINFYEANVSINNVSFLNNNSEDALNIIRSTFKIEDVVFNNIKSDAFDGDFCNGSVKNTEFINIGNDALDFSGSTIEIENVLIKGVGDKGISAGENSNITCKDIKINSCELGLVSKDLSKLIVNNSRLENVAVPYVVFQKKGVFGPASIELNNYSAIGFKRAYLIESKSVAIVDGNTIDPNHENVSSILYGELFGKSSK